MDFVKVIKKYPKLLDRKTTKVVKQIAKDGKLNILQLHNRTGVSYTECTRIVNRLTRKDIISRSQKKRKRGSPVILRLKKR